MAYKEAGLKPPRVIQWFDDPYQAVAWLKDVTKGFGKNAIVSSNAMQSIFHGQFEAGSMGFYDFFQRYVPEIKGIEAINGLQLIAKSCGWVWLFEGVAVCVERPAEIHLDGDALAGTATLHNTKGPAVKWRSGKGLYFVRGVPVDAEGIESPTAAYIQKQANAEVRRVLLESYGTSKYLKEIDAKEESRDIRGSIFRATMEGDEDLVMVRYINRTAEAGVTHCPYCDDSSNNTIEWSAAIGGKPGTLGGRFCKCGAFVEVSGQKPVNVEVPTYYDDRTGKVVLEHTEKVTRNGFYKVYWHRVPPGTHTGTEAYEWMYGIQELRGKWETVDES
jgi:hypothetical protein